MQIENAMNSQDYNIFVTLLNMSKAFDSIKRPQLIKDLSKVLNDDELHMYYILLYKMQYTVQDKLEMQEENPSKPTKEYHKETVQAL